MDVKGFPTHDVSAMGLKLPGACRAVLGYWLWDETDHTLFPAPWYGVVLPTLIEEIQRLDGVTGSVR